MARLSIALSLLLVLSVAWLALLPFASAGFPSRIARTRQAQSQYLRQRRLRDGIDRGTRPPVHMYETITHTDSEAEKLERVTRGARAESADTPIKYKGGRVMADGVNVYIIYYGSWPAGSGKALIENFIRSLSAGSNRQGDPEEPKVKKWWAINEQYYQEINGARKNVSLNVTLVGTVYDNYSAGKAFKDRTETAWKVVSSKIGDGKAFPYDPHGIYLLLTSPDVTIAGYCANFCGWHSADMIAKNMVVYSLVGHHKQCPERCGAAKATPSGDPALDATISTIAHELAEAATNPDARNGWQDEEGEENADVCAHLYGDTLKGVDDKSEEYQYNLVGMGSQRYLVQTNLDNANSKCVSQASG